MVRGDLEPGVSVVVATRDGRSRLPSCLQALMAQDIRPSAFEVIVVANGTDDGTLGDVADLRDADGRHALRLLHSDRPGAGRARNLGVAAARFAHVTFVDDDDTVGPRFASTLLALTGPSVIPAVGIVDVADGPDGARQPVPSAIGDQAARHAGQDVVPADVPGVVACNAAKLVPTAVARGAPFAAELESGEDLVFFARLAVEWPFLVRFAPPTTGAEYCRHVRAGSVSRRDEPDWAFAVEQRLAVLAHLDRLAGRTDANTRRLVDVFMGGQVDAMHRYLRAHPDDRARVLAAVEAAELRAFPYPRLNAGAAEELVVSYCFPPDLDTSGIVAAKRVHQAGRVVDVVSNRMALHRAADPSTLRIAEAQIERHEIIDTEPDFNSWDSIVAFCRHGRTAVQRLAEGRAAHRRLYSRALWPGSHVLAGLVKAERPGIHWQAEYSDPMSHDIHGRKRPNPLKDDDIVAALVDAAARSGVELSPALPMFAFVEALPMALADELVFTNPQQRDVMLAYAPSDQLRQRAAAIATIDPHPTLPPRFYSLQPAAYPLEPGRAHLAYFGAFYASRGLDDVLGAIGGLDPERRRLVRLHVFTAKPDHFAEVADDLGVGDAVVARHYVPFLSFLNLCTRFDALVLSDTETSSSHSVSPYLPSKWSDYRGSGRPIWAIIEPGSPLSRQTSMSYRSPLGDPGAGRSTLEQIIDDTLATRASSGAAEHVS